MQPITSEGSVPERDAVRERNLPSMPSFALPITEVMIVADCWQAEPDAEAVIHRAIQTAAGMVDSGMGEAELAVMLTDDSGIRTLNRNWRGQDKPTNVLSFPALQPPMRRCGARPMTSKSRSAIISAILRFTVSCIWSDTITRKTPKLRTWKR